MEASTVNRIDVMHHSASLSQCAAMPWDAMGCHGMPWDAMGGMCVCVVGDAPNELSRAVATKCSEALGSEAGVGAENVEAVRNRQKRPINATGKEITRNNKKIQEVDMN